jgi:hypothetical protein
MLRILFLLTLCAGSALCELRHLLVISVDGLDHRYLRDRDAMGLKIPNLRKLLAKSEMVDGVTGVLGTVTWPSHTSMITGVRPVEHGILNNKRPASEGGDYYWTPSLLKTKTLWHRVHEAGGKTSAITWPVTTDAQIDFNLPEYFKRRNGGAMDFDAISEKSTPGLIEKIRAAYPSFGTEWIDDRNRTLATMYIVSKLRPNLMLLHLVDLDSEQHERGPFTAEAKAQLEYEDELIGRILSVTPADFNVALVSDHGFELTKRILSPLVLLQNAKVPAGRTVVLGGAVVAYDAAVAKALKGADGVGREIPMDELKRYAPELAEGAVAAFEPAANVMFDRGTKDLWPAFKPKGEHGLWPARPDYRSVYAVSGPGIKAGMQPGISMLEINGRFEKLLGLK